jgi:hypothetical protein
MATFPHKLGTSRAGAGTRLWLEGKRLTDHGFTHGAFVCREWHEGKLRLSVIDAATFEALPRSERTTVAGSASRPIIDITGTQVSQAFPSGHVTATWFTDGRCIVKGVTND